MLFKDITFLIKRTISFVYFTKKIEQLILQTFWMYVNIQKRLNFKCDLFGHFDVCIYNCIYIPE